MKTLKDKESLSRYMAEDTYKNLFPASINMHAILRRADAGDVLIHQGEEPVSFIYLARGRCSVSCVLPNGKTILLKTVSAPSVLGEMELVSPERSALTVKSLDTCDLIVFPMKMCRTILLNDNAFLRRLCVLLGNKERQSVIRFFTSAGYPLEKRLAAFILEQREEDYFRIRKVQAAQSLGVSYRHLETVLNRYVEEGILSKNRLTYHIEDEAALLNLAREMTDVV